MPVETPAPRDISQLSWQPGTGTLQRLHTSGLRLTQARRAVLRALHDNRGRFLDAEAVHRWTKAATWRVNLTSVYRILAELDKARIAQATQLGARTFYCMVPEGEAAQPHFVCRRCGHAQALGSDVLLTQLFEGAARLGFHLNQRLTLVGVCSACNANAPQSRHRADLQSEIPYTQGTAYTSMTPAQPTSKSPSNEPISKETQE